MRLSRKWVKIPYEERTNEVIKKIIEHPIGDDETPIDMIRLYKRSKITLGNYVTLDYSYADFFYDTSSAEFHFRVIT